MKPRSGAGQGRWRETLVFTVRHAHGPAHANRMRIPAERQYFRHAPHVQAPCSALGPGVGLHGRPHDWAISPSTGKPHQRWPTTSAGFGRHLRSSISWKTAVGIRDFWGRTMNHQGDSRRAEEPAKPFVSVRWHCRNPIMVAPARGVCPAPGALPGPFADAFKGKIKILVDSAPHGLDIVA